MFTRRDYPALNDLVSTFDERFVILGFPTSQFDNQEPGDASEILDCLYHVRPGGGFVPAFQLMAKSAVNGDGEHSLWTWLKGLCPLPTQFNYGAISWTPVKAYDISWNFEKFLIDSSGRPCMRYDASVPAADLSTDIQAMLQANGTCVLGGGAADCALVSGAPRRLR